MKNITEFLTAANLASKAEFARSLNFSPQQLNQALQRDSNTFQLAFREAYPNWVMVWEDREHKFFVLGSAENQGVDVVTLTRDDLLISSDTLIECPEIYAFLAATGVKKFDICFDTPEKRYISFSEYGAAIPLGLFPVQRIPQMAKWIEQIANDDTPD
jgi:hypothetical protein